MKAIEDDITDIFRVHKGWFELLKHAANKKGLDINKYVPDGWYEDKSNWDIRTIRYIHNQLTADVGDISLFTFVSEGVNPLTFGTYSVALWTAETPYQFLRVATENIICISPQLRMKVTENENEVEVLFIDNVSAKSSKVSQQGILLVLTTFLEMLKSANNGVPIKAKLKMCDLGDYSELISKKLKDLYDCEIVVSTPFYRFIFATEDLQKVMPNADAVTFNANLMVTKRLTRQLSSINVVARINNELDDLVTLRNVDIKYVAAKLLISPRTLNRRLSDVGTTFRITFDNYRLEHAITLLKQPNASVSEVAYYLGFSEASSFARAFKRWTGVCPTRLNSTSIL